MKNALIVYASTSGNAYLIGQCVQTGLERAGYTVTLKNVKQVKADEFGGYDLVVLGSSTWNTGGKQGQLQEDMFAFVEQNGGVDFGQKAMAVFGVGHHSYTFVVKAAETLQEFVQKHNGRLVGEAFKVDDVADLFFGQAEEWGANLASA